MSEFREKTVDADAAQPGNPLQAAVERILMSFGDQTFQEYSRYRFAEEREWYEEALFYQRRQWLKWNDSARRFDVVKQDSDKPKPMPVTNYFKKAINSNANQLQKTKMSAVPCDLNDQTRRAGQYAEKAIDAIDCESGFDVLRPLLAKHVPLWGIGCTWDSVDTSASAGMDQVGEFGTNKRAMVSCLDCGDVSDVTNAAPATPAGNQQTDSDPNRPNMNLGDDGSMEPPASDMEGKKCPKCGSPNVVPYDALDLTVGKVHQFPKGKLFTEIAPIFEIYLPRDCRNPNLAKRIVRRYRKPLGSLRQKYGERAAKIKAEAPYDVHQIYMEALRALVNYNYMHEQTIETTTITELWCEWDELPRKVQQRLETFWQDDTETLETAIRQGVYLIYAGGTMLDWGVNPWWDPAESKAHKPATFFLWELDPASTYPAGPGSDLVPLQKRLNRIDSLIELAYMCNAAGKWLWPSTQTGKTPSGSPNEVVYYEAIGEGKVKPEFQPGQAIDVSAHQLRAQIISDFQAIGNTLGVAEGMPAPGVKSFRGTAYLGQKAEEQTNTTRELWETAHELRYKKVLLMAQQCWDEDRAVKVAGYNGRFSMTSLNGQMLSGNYRLELVPDSSRPVLPSERKEAFATALQGGMIDLSDSATREYVLDLLDLDEVNLTDHLQYEKAERDLEMMKQGQLPPESPFQKWDIFLKVFANFTLTEEFAELPQPIQQGILLYTSHLNQMMTMAAQPQVNPQAAQQLAGAMQKKGKNSETDAAGHDLEAVPGSTISSGAAQNAAAQKGAQVSAAVGA